MSRLITFGRQLNNGCVTLTPAESLWLRDLLSRVTPWAGVSITSGRRLLEAEAVGAGQLFIKRHEQALLSEFAHSLEPVLRPTWETMQGGDARCELIAHVVGGLTPQPPRGMSDQEAYPVQPFEARPFQVRLHP